jgi:hypothetical protein
MAKMNWENANKMHPKQRSYSAMEQEIEFRLSKKADFINGQPERFKNAIESRSNLVGVIKGDYINFYTPSNRKVFSLGTRNLKNVLPVWVNDEKARHLVGIVARKYSFKIRFMN